ncbi:3D domain-containing protein [Virgibacillus halophilus]|uniref:3D domain-containing protein n=1 Tax=Tigheibacillus halophilus TaxID=361280 RepID=A0ABU5C4S1_9BACI|nr:3D domain-containing protein [Virgibacillus halophilus]
MLLSQQKKQTSQHRKLKKAEPKQASNENGTPEGKTVSVTATAYTANCDGCSGVTSTGIDLKKNPDQKVIAVDPNVIPLGSKVYVDGYGYATAGDIGGAIKGHKIDVHMPNDGKAKAWGVKNVNVTIVK